MISWNNERQEMMNNYKTKWEKEGIEKEPKTIKREALKSIKGISESQMKGWETERLEMMEGITNKYKERFNNPIKMGSST